MKVLLAICAVNCWGQVESLGKLKLAKVLSNVVLVGEAERTLDEADELHEDGEDHDEERDEPDFLPMVKLAYVEPT